jgi:polysaccharide export outer membrane protein
VNYERVIKTKVNKRLVEKELKRLHQLESIKYRIGKGDKLDITVYGESELTLRGSLVKEDGTISMSMVGDIYVYNLTVNEAIKKIQDSLSIYLKEAIVSVVPVEFKARSYTILGKVNASGKYSLVTKTTILDAITEAKGLATGTYDNNTVELADLEHSYIKRDNKILPVDFVELIKNGDQLHNIPLKDKDYIYIPSISDSEVYIMGATGTSSQRYSKDLTLTKLIVKTGGFTESADINEIAVIRGSLTHPTVFLVDLEAILEGRRLDFFLKEYDIVYVPNSKLGDWNSILNLLTSSIAGIQTIFITRDFFKNFSDNVQ